MITLYVKLGDEDICAAFQELSPPKAVKQVMIYEKGQEVLCDVVGWKSDPEPSPTPALAQRVTDSGDAQAILIRGGNLGILFKPAHIQEPWNPKSPNQEHRAYLVIAGESALRYSN